MQLDVHDDDVPNHSIMGHVVLSVWSRWVGWRAAVAMTVLGCTALAAACSSPSPSPAHQAAASLHPLATRYLTIARAGNRRLETDFDSLAGPGSRRLAVAQADLRDAAATERLFDRRLLAIAFPAPIERVARLLAGVNEARASLATTAAASVSLRQLATFQPKLTAANGQVEEAVRVLRGQLGLPPPDTS